MVGPASQESDSHPGASRGPRPAALWRDQRWKSGAWVQILLLSRASPLTFVI